MAAEADEYEDEDEEDSGEAAEESVSEADVFVLTTGNFNQTIEEAKYALVGSLLSTLDHLKSHSSRGFPLPYISNFFLWVGPG